MNIRRDSRNECNLWASSDCPFCGRLLPQCGPCKCGVWKRTPIDSPSYIITLTEKGPELAKDSAYFGKQYAEAKAEKEAARGTQP